MKLPKISAYSTALYSSFWFIDPWRLLFDCGDGASTFLQQKGRKVKHIFISHADRDHLAGLFRFLEVNAPAPGANPIQVYYPKDCGSFPAIESFLEKFDPHVAGRAEWHGIAAGDTIAFKPGHEVEVYPNQHVARRDNTSEGAHKSLSFSVFQTADKLRPEFQHLTGPEIGEMRKQGADIFEKKRVNRLTYSADTPIEPASYWRDPEILIHEATFLSRADCESRGQEMRHSALSEVIEMVAEMPNLKALVLGHFSTRYNQHQVRECLEQEIERVGIQIPVTTVPPGKFIADLFSEEETDATQ